jgi:hypothetical protein
MGARLLYRNLAVAVREPSWNQRRYEIGGAMVGESNAVPNAEYIAATSAVLRTG